MSRQSVVDAHSAAVGSLTAGRWVFLALFLVAVHQAVWEVVRDRA